MLELLRSIVVAVGVAFAWMALWAFALGVLGIPVFMRTPKERASRKRRILQMGKLQYIFLFGVLGGGFGLGLGVAIALMMQRHTVDWGFAAAIFGGLSLVGGFFNGVRGWNNLFHRGEVPFPPAYPPSK